MWTDNLTTVANLATGGALFLIGLLIGSFVRPYLAKKGENLATLEDIQGLVDQVAAVTTTTKKIEAEISTGVWDKQKRWDMKREVLFDAAKKSGRGGRCDAHLCDLDAGRSGETKAWVVLPPSMGQQVAGQR